ncbi:MAG: hypothetical protein M1840_009009 [Geoglossum simile]|nr:MAG: hypothetical protein M1840_009009 [Geoglossum simile]
MTLASPKLDHNMSPVSNNRPSLAGQIGMDKWREKTWELVARVQQEEDERVKAYKERSGYGTTENENGSVSHRDSARSGMDRSASPPAHPGNLSLSNLGQTRGLRQRSLTSPTAPARIGFPSESQHGFEGSLRRETLPSALRIGDSSLSRARLSDGALIPPELPPKTSQKRVEPPNEHPGGTQGEGKNLFADVDRFIDGSNMYGRRGGVRTEPQTPTSPKRGGPVSAPGGGMTFPQGLDLDRRRKRVELPRATEFSTTLSTNNPNIGAPPVTPPLELDSAPIIELSAQLSLRKKAQPVSEHQPPRRQRSPPPQQEASQTEQTQPQPDTARQNNPKPPPAPPPKKQHLAQFAANRKPLGNASGGAVMPTSVTEQQAIMVGGAAQTQRAKVERDQDSQKERVGTVAEGLALRKLFSPKIQE